MPFPEPIPPAPRKLLISGIALSLAVPVLLPFDHWLVVKLNPENAGIWDHALHFLDELLPVIMLTIAVIAGGGFWLYGRSPATRRGGFILGLSPFVANRLTGVLKHLVQRPRPQHDVHGIEGLRILRENVELSSFPSGHVTTTAAFAIALLFLLPPVRGRSLVLLLIPAMIWNRVALGMHFPSDTLAGVAVASLTLALFARLLRDRDPGIGRRIYGPTIVALLLLVTWAWRLPAQPIDPGTGEPLEQFELVPRTLRTLFEPFVGPGLELAYAPDLEALAVASAPWLALVVTVLLVLFRRQGLARGLMPAAFLLLVLAMNAGLSWLGCLPADGFRARVPGVFLDLHVHGSDPVDGARALDGRLAAARARGIGVVAVTNHDAPPPTVEGIPGTEWSGYRHPAEPFLHLVVLGGDGAFPDLLARAVLPLDGPPGDTHVVIRDAIEAAKHAGAIVLVAHYWTTARAMGARGTLAHLPPPAALADFGVDGFEVGNARPVARDDDQGVVAEIDRLCRERGLLRIASSDDHGRLSGSPCVTFLPGDFPEEAGARARAAWVRLRGRGAAIPVVFTRGRGDLSPPGLIAGPVALWRYLASLTIPARLSWLGWCALGWALWMAPWRRSGKGRAKGRAPRLNASLSGSRAPAPASSPR